MVVKSNTPLIRAFHRLALALPALGETLFDVDSRLVAQDVQRTDLPQHARHVFVAGLPGGGSGAFSRLAGSSGGFCSLSYRDMPFVMAPNLWARLSRLWREEARRHHAAAPVAALDEVFWRVHCGRDYIKPRHLARIDVPDATIDAFRRYVDNVLVRYGERRYLSNNANNLLRLAALREAFPRAVLVVPFREPLVHASALLKRHRRRQRPHRVDPLSRGMTRWLVKHQLGTDHRPYFDDEPGAPAATNHVDYWLRQWIRVHGAIERQVMTQRLLPVAGERLASEPDGFGRALRLAAGLPLTGPPLSSRIPSAMVTNPDPAAQASPVLVGVAQDLYGRLDALSVVAVKHALVACDGSAPPHACRA